MTEKLWQFTEKKYGRLAVRLQWASKDDFSTYNRACYALSMWFNSVTDPN